MAERTRCAWATAPETIVYHDEEWGVPVRDDRLLFELITLEGAQAGLSWITVLRKRAGYRAAFANFDPRIVATFDDARIDAIARDPAVVRHRGKIAATVGNARAFLAVQAEFQTFARYLWAFVDGVPIVNRPASGDKLPAKTDLSDRISVDLKRRGFTFVGSTIVYAFLQATGIVDDHATDCFCALRP